MSSVENIRRDRNVKEAHCLFRCSYFRQRCKLLFSVNDGSHWDCCCITLNATHSTQHCAMLNHDSTISHLNTIKAHRSVTAPRRRSQRRDVRLRFHLRSIHPVQLLDPGKQSCLKMFSLHLHASSRIRCVVARS